ncbi:MAG: ABC transporter permease [Chloroflexota bacterium]|nr:MAG: ABC transporter permease [Chloroflexota bacterium]
MSVKSDLQTSVSEFQIPNSNLAVPHLRIRPSRGWSALKLREVWEYRELLYFLVWRDVKVRYKQTALGVLWVVLQPLATTIVFTLIFGNLAKMPSENLPYAVFALAGLLPWNYFSGAIGRGGSSLVGSANLISKVYFPRLIIPISSVLAGLVDFGITFLLLVALMLFYGYPPTLSWLLLPFFLLMAIATALGVSLWLSALNVQYRDVGYLIPFLIQLWFFATPVVYPSSLIPAPWSLLYALNPMAGVVDGFRWALFGNTAAPGPLILVSIAVVIVTLVSGLFVFKRMERTFADVV